MMSKDPDFPIDFVIPWVDGADPIWQEKKQNIKVMLQQRATLISDLKTLVR